MQTSRAATVDDRVMLFARQSARADMPNTVELYQYTQLSDDQGGTPETWLPFLDEYSETKTWPGRLDTSDLIVREFLQGSALEDRIWRIITVPEDCPAKEYDRLRLLERDKFYYIQQTYESSDMVTRECLVYDLDEV